MSQLENVCPSCGSQQSQAWLCHDCCVTVTTMVAAVPQLVDQLNIAVSKQAKVGGNGKAGKGSAHTKSPLNFGALAVRDALLVAAAFVGEDIDWVRKHPQAAEMVRDLGQAVKDAYRAIDRAQDRKYLGKCLNVVDGDECQAELWAAPKAKQFRCRICQYEHVVAERQNDMMELSEDMLFTVREASQVIGSYGERSITESTIRSYVSTGQLGYHGKAKGSSLIRLGDLMEVIREQAAKTRGRKLRRVS